MRARGRHPSFCPRLGTRASEARTKAAQGWELQMLLARSPSLARWRLVGQTNFRAGQLPARCHPPRDACGSPVRVQAVPAESSWRWGGSTAGGGEGGGKGRRGRGDGGKRAFGRTRAFQTRF